MSEKRAEQKAEQVIEIHHQSKISRGLDKYFHFTDRGSTMSREVKAGLSVFFISVCALFMNIQIVITAFSDNIPYCGLYLGATITAFIGTLLMGLLCNLPLVQTASLSMSTVMISMMGADSGLTYANLLAVTLVAAVVYLMVMAVPVLRKFLYHLIPDSVRSALPAAMGLYIAYVALEHMGITDGMSLASLSEDAMGGATLAPYMRLCVIAGLIGFAFVLINLKRKSETPVLSGFLTATLAFFLIASVAGGIAFTYVFTQNRIWIGVNPDSLGEMYTIGLGFKELQFGTVFREGFDFSAFTAAGGSVAGLFVRAILMFLFLGMYESEASAQRAALNCQSAGKACAGSIAYVATGDAAESQNGSIRQPAAGSAEVTGSGNGKYEKTVGKVWLVNAVTNVIAPIFGAAPVSVAKQSSAATADGGKTGLSSIVCALGYLVSMFTWIPFVIFAIYTKSVPEYGHAGFVFPNVIYATFQIADAVMLVLGLRMLKSLKDLKEMENSEILPYGVTVVMTVFTQNIAYGVAAGCITAVLMTLAGLKKKEITSLPAARYVMAVLSVVLLVLSLTVPALGSSAAGTNGNGSADGSAAEAESSENGIGDAAGTLGTAENTNGFTFDPATGDFSFAGSADVDYYTVWIYALDEEGQEGSSYVAASSRLSGEGEISGNVDLSMLPFGNYHANLLAFAADGSVSDPIVLEFTVSGKLSVPEFKYAQDGTSVTITLYSGTLTTYNENELFADIDVNIYDENGEVVQTETITDGDLIGTAMGPMMRYSCEKTIPLEAGTYKISLTAKGDGNIAEASDESEQLELTVADGATSEGLTSGYVEEEGGPMP